MKNLILFLALSIITLSSKAANSPYAPWVDDFVDNSDYNPKRIQRGLFDYSAIGGAQGSYSLGVKIPANSIITHTYFHNTVAFVDGGSGTVSLGCESTGDLYASTDITGNSTGDITEGIQDDTIANYATIESGCVPRVHIDGADITEGKLNVFFEYIQTK